MARGAKFETYFPGPTTPMRPLGYRPDLDAKFTAETPVMRLGPAWAESRRGRVPAAVLAITRICQRGARLPVSLGTEKSFLVLFFKKEQKNKAFFFEKKKQKTFFR